MYIGKGCLVSLSRGLGRVSSFVTEKESRWNKELMSQ